MKNLSWWFGLALLTLVGVSGCGGGSGNDGGASVTPPISSVQAASGLATALNSFDGTQSSPVSSTGSIAGGVTYSFTVLGFSFCNPTDPFVVPLASPPVGQTIYGCANAVQGTALMDTNALTLTMTLVVPDLYVDFGMSTTQLGITTNYAGALTATNPAASVTYNLVAQPDGNYKLGSVSSSNFAATWNIQSMPSLLATIVNLIKPLVEASANSALTDYLTTQATAYAATAIVINP